ncbi:MAG: hypothetical protein HGA33_00015 [Candidatus Moranbacteria bacterium]|nr:hypothetical protein [Candidatus Moranbacteria bacterium]
MPGMNLAQSTQQGKIGNGRHIGKGLIFLLSVIAAVVVIWIGFSFYERFLSGGIADAEARIVEERQNMSIEKVDKVTDFQFRLERIAAEKRDSLGPAEMLASVESLILPSVKLSEFTYEESERTIHMIGEADSFRTVVQQMVLLKKMPELETLTVPTLGRNKDGRIDFTFTIIFGQ